MKKSNKLDAEQLFFCYICDKRCFMKTKALLVYTSLTGCTEKMAEFLTAELRSKGVDVDFRHCSEADPKDFLEYDIALVGTYTYGAHGDLPDEIVDFYFDLGDVDLSGK